MRYCVNRRGPTACFLLVESRSVASFSARLTEALSNAGAKLAPSLARRCRVAAAATMHFGVRINLCRVTSVVSDIRGTSTARCFGRFGGPPDQRSPVCVCVCPALSHRVAQSIDLGACDAELSDTQVEWENFIKDSWIHFAPAPRQHLQVPGRFGRVRSTHRVLCACEEWNGLRFLVALVAP